MLNLTPHAIIIRTPAGDVTIPPSGTVARVSANESVRQYIELPFGKGVVQCAAIERAWGEVEGLPDEGVPCLVSALVLSAVPGRKGVYAPDTGATAVRNERGQIEAVTRLVAA